MVISSGELVFIPTPAMGHILSAAEVAKRLIERDERVSIVIIIINFRIACPTIINAFLDAQSRDNPYPTRLTFLTLPPLSNLLEPSSSGRYVFQTYLELYKQPVKQALEDRLRAGGSPPLSGFVLDMFCSEKMSDVAAHFNVPSYIFFTTGAGLLNLFFHFQSLVEDKGVDEVVTEFSNPEARFYVPGFLNPLTRFNIPEAFIDLEGGTTSITLNFARDFRNSKGILVNTFLELESSATQALFDLVAKDSIPPIYPVGPIIQLDNESRSEDDHSSILQWLDDQPSSSVVFLCFGSMGNFDAAQVKEIAYGLEKSGYGFLWSLRKPPRAGGAEGKTGGGGEESEIFAEALPEGFVERTRERGKVIGWAPQVSILAHRAVGGFVSHCGWNSTLESLWFGVPMATWPLYAEQQLNAFELVKELGLAAEIWLETTKKGGKFLVKAQEIENGLNKLMCDEETKKKVKEMRDKSRQALEDGGSSHQWLGRFIQHVFHNVS